MPEDLLFNGLVDEVEKAGFGDSVIGLRREGSFIEGDKIACKRLCREYGVPVADKWQETDAKNYDEVLGVCLTFLDKYGGAVIKYPYSAGGKGARVVLNSWEIREIYETLMKDYSKSYKSFCGNRSEWPLLIESRMSGAEISFTALVDKNGSFQILPTAMDYPERFSGPASKDNPITGGMGSISPHPMETPGLIRKAAEDIVKPFITALREKELLRPCVLYPGCFVSFDNAMKPTKIRMCEMNIRPGEPEAQPIFRRIRNLGALIKATVHGNLTETAPEVRSDQISICIALVTGAGGPQGQKGYPWSCTKGEVVKMDLDYLKKKGIQAIPSAMTCSEDEKRFKSDGTRVVYLNANATVKPGESRAEIAERLRKRVLTAFTGGRVRVIPREDPEGNRLDLRTDVGVHFDIAEKVFPAERKSER